MAKLNIASITPLLLWFSGSATAMDSAGLLRIPLVREVVPVSRNGKVVSSKTSYSGALSLGQPAQEFRVVMDTGSGHVVVPSQMCQSKPCVTHRRYDLNASTTGTAINADGSEVGASEFADQLTIGFGTGEVLGEFAHEKVCLRGSEAAEKAHCVDLRIVTAVEMSEQPFSAFSFDGILGLSLSGLALSPEFSFFESWAARESSNPLAAQFAFFLTDEDEASSEIVIGGHDKRQLLEPLAWAPVALPKMGFWQLQILAVRVGGVELDFCRTGDCRGVFDTGTSHIGVPAPFDQQLVELMTVPEAAARAGDSETDCRMAAAPELEIEVPGMTLTLGPEFYMRKMALRKDVRLSESGVQMQLRPPATAHAEKYCRPRLMPVKLPAPLGPKLFLLGEPMLQRYYTVFDWKSQQIGIGLSANRRNIDARARAQARKAEEEQRKQEQDGPKQVDEILLLQLPGRATLSKTRAKPTGDSDEAEVCDEESRAL